MNRSKRIAFITNLCPSYRVKAFQRLAKLYPVDFYFYSKPDESAVTHLDIAGPTNEFRYLSTVRILMRLMNTDYGIQIKCTNGRYITLFSFLIAKIMRRKFILWHTIWYNPRTLFRRVSLPILNWIMNCSDAIVVYGEHGKRYLESLGVKAGKIFIAWQAVDNERFNRPVDSEEISGLRRQFGVTGKHVILFVGRLVAEKGLPYLVEALSLLKDDRVCLMLIGDGPLKSSLEAQCAQSQLKNCVFIGNVPNSDLYKYYALADVFVLPSVTTREFKEPWGLVVNEAMNQGTPVVVTGAVGAGVGGLVDEGVNGLVVPERDSTALSAALRKILSDDGLRMTMGQNARRTIKEWTYERMVKGFADAIEYAQDGIK